MRKLLIGMLALGLAIAFATPASALDIRVSGHYMVEGWYIDNYNLTDGAVSNIDDSSRAFYSQRLRVATTFAVAQNLMVNARFDAMEGIWGAGASQVWDPTGATGVGANLDTNIEFDYVNMRFITACGLFDVGYLRDATWGTDFGNSEEFTATIAHTMPIPGTNLINVLAVRKMAETDWNRPVITGATAGADGDRDDYIWAFMYRGETLEAGNVIRHARDAQVRAGAAPFDHLQTLWVVSPYFKATLGDLYLEGQLYYFRGKLEYEDPSAGAILARQAALPFVPFTSEFDMDLRGLSYYIKGQYNAGPARLGALWAKAEGNDINDPTTVGGLGTGGGDWSPMLILWNDHLWKWGGGFGNMGTDGVAFTTDRMANASVFQIFAGFQASKDLDIFLSYAWARAHRDQQVGQLSKKIGREFDVQVSYQLFENLEYEVAFGYFWAGDFYKGANPLAPVDDNYLLFHRLTLSF